MQIVLTAFHLIDLVLRLTWPIILVADTFFRTKTPYKQRTERGRHFKWMVKQFGPAGPTPIVLLGWIFAIACAFTPAGRVGIDTVMIYLAGALIVDWITGSDDPPYKRWLTSLSEAVKKLKVKQPKPVFSPT